MSEITREASITQLHHTLGTLATELDMLPRTSPDAATRIILSDTDLPELTADRLPPALWLSNKLLLSIGLEANDTAWLDIRRHAQTDRAEEGYNHHAWSVAVAAAPNPADTGPAYVLRAEAPKGVRKFSPPFPNRRDPMHVLQVRRDNLASPSQVTLPLPPDFPGGHNTPVAPVSDEEAQLLGVWMRIALVASHLNLAKGEEVIQPLASDSASRLSALLQTLA